MVWLWYQGESWWIWCLWLSRSLKKVLFLSSRRLLHFMHFWLFAPNYQSNWDVDATGAIQDLREVLWVVGVRGGCKKPVVFDHATIHAVLETKHGELKAKRHGLKNFDSAKHMKKDAIQLTQAVSHVKLSISITFWEQLRILHLKNADVTLNYLGAQFLDESSGHKPLNLVEGPWQTPRLDHWNDLKTCGISIFVLEGSSNL